MNKNFKKVLVTVVAAIVLVVGVFVIKDNFTSTAVGKIQVELVDLEGNARTKSIAFEEGDTLVSLIESNYENVVIEDGMIMTIEDFTTASDWSTFISIYVNDEMSMVGIKEIEFTDGTKISFIMTEFVYE